VDGQLILYILMMAFAILVAVYYIVWTFLQVLRLRKSVYGIDYQELEAIRRHLPTILRVILNRKNVTRYNEKMVLPNAANQIVYNFRKADEMERLAIYALAIVDEHYELLSELSKVVDEDFKNKVPVMLDVINNFYNKESKPIQ
jgi:hypothetical protein